MSRHRFDDDENPHRWGGPALTSAPSKAPGHHDADEDTEPLPTGADLATDHTTTPSHDGEPTTRERPSPGHHFPAENGEA
ncbi:hypothetical protein [Prauserella flavalba]|uniref:Uncharacterized protein n=1 Tax=Prauserella flavalba TaxID=1477506 RepID=A0A318M3R3_9PSEU|nr:hypothetical protein [Prauserella flavalba]PXY37426.1 hypothetical protein BA062_06805 [Prauserella flavalba]